MKANDAVEASAGWGVAPDEPAAATVAGSVVAVVAEQGAGVVGVEASVELVVVDVEAVVVAGAGVVVVVSTAAGVDATIEVVVVDVEVLLVVVDGEVVEGLLVDELVVVLLGQMVVVVGEVGSVVLVVLVVLVLVVVVVESATTLGDREQQPLETSVRAASVVPLPTTDAGADSTAPATPKDGKAATATAPTATVHSPTERRRIGSSSPSARLERAGRAGIRAGHDTALR